MVVGKYFRVVRRGSPATNAFIMRDEDLPNKELYATKRMIHIKNKALKKIFYIWRDLPLTPP